MPAAISLKAVKMAATRKGARYHRGSVGPRSFDCSGLTKWSYAKVGRQLERAVEALAPKWAEVKVTLLHGGDPVLVDVGHPAFDVLDDAFEEVVGRRAVQVRSGGSIPIIPELGLAGAPVLLTGIGLPDDGLHSPNEKLDLEQLWSGIRIFGRFFELFAERGGAGAEGPAEATTEEQEVEAV